jgi:hypothetical protein
MSGTLRTQHPDRVIDGGLLQPVPTKPRLGDLRPLALRRGVPTRVNPDGTSRLHADPDRWRR